jgi:HlyD family secretion protein
MNNKNRKIAIGGGIILLVLAAWFVFGRNKTDAEKELTATVSKGEFIVSVTGTGELRAKNQTDISAPRRLMDLGIYQVKIQSIVDEGTRVKTGELVASLDQTDVSTKISEETLNVQKKESEYKQAELDTTLTLREARSEILGIKFSLQEKKLIKEQSKYEAPAVIRQAELDYERTEKSFEEKSANYKTKVEQAKAKMQIIGSDLQKARNKLNDLVSLTSQLNIMAPKAGMIIYAKEWNGKKRVAGTSINMWDPQVAALPDLSVMETVTYINEVDIQKIKKDQKVSITLDADPNKKLTGSVTDIANIGEQKPGSDAKVFEVVISVNEKDSTLWPAMTTACKIMSASIPNALYVPLESVRNDGAGSYVIVKSSGKSYKQEVTTGAFNEASIVITAGLKGDETVLLSTPSDLEKLEWVSIPK